MPQARDQTAPLPDPSASASVRAIALLSVAAFASAATTRICDGLLPQISAGLGVTTGAAAQVITAYSASYGLLQIAFGTLGDRFGKERTLVAACVASLFTTLACALATTLPQLVTARLLAGATAAGIIPLSLAWIGDAIPYEKRQPVIARFITGQIAGLIVGLAFGGVIGEAWGWRAAFWLIAAMYVAATAGLLLQFGTVVRESRRAPSTAGSMRATLGLLRVPWVRVVLTMTMLEGLLGFGALAYVTTTLHERFGLGYAAAGFTLSAFGAGGLVFSFFAPAIVSRLGEVGGARAGASLSAVAFLGFAIMPNVAAGVGASFAAGLGYYALHNVLQFNATQMAPQARGAAVALFATSFFVGQGIGVALAAPVVDRYGARPVFIMAAILLPACAFVFSGALARRDATRLETSA